jgi:signal transduction histidine kinase
VVWYLVLFAVLLTVSILTIQQLLVARLDRDIDEAFVQEVEEVRLLAGGVDPGTGEPFADDPRPVFETFLRRNVPQQGEVFFTLVAGSPYASSAEPVVDLFKRPDVVAQWAATTDSTYGSTDTERGPVRWLAVPVGGPAGPSGVFVVTQFYGDDRDEIADATRIVAIVAASVLVLATFLGWLGAGRALAPIGRLERAARRAGIDDLSERLPVEGNDELARLTETFNDLLERLETAVVSQRQFLSDVGHDLRTPLTILHGQLELLPEDPAERAATIALCLDELARMDRYVRGLSLLAKAEQPDFLVPGAIDLAELTTGMLRRGQGLAADRTWVLEGLSSAVVEGDVDRITQAWLNLVSNAVQHTEPGDRIALGSEHRGSQVRLWVSDSGPGVADEDATRIFDRFARVGSTRERRPEGSGLGLAIVQAIAQAHGGSVAVEPKVGPGALFVMSLPLPVVEPEGASRAADPNASAPSVEVPEP